MHSGSFAKELDPVFLLQNNNNNDDDYNNNSNERRGEEIFGSHIYGINCVIDAHLSLNLSNFHIKYTELFFVNHT